MGSVNHWISTANRRARRLYVEVGSELRNGRSGTGLSQARVAGLIGVSQMQVSRLERGEANARLEVLAAFAAVVGCDLAMRIFPSGPRVRDRAQLALLARLQAETPRVRWTTETPIPIPGDRRAIDAVGRCANGTVGAELESRLGDWQSVARRVLLKQRDAALDSMLIVLPDTRHNRAAIAAAGHAAWNTFPLRSRAIMAALRRGEAPAANGILFR